MPAPSLRTSAEMVGAARLVGTALALKRSVRTAARHSSEVPLPVLATHTYHQHDGLNQSTSRRLDRETRNFTESYWAIVPGCPQPGTILAGLSTATAAEGAFLMAPGSSRG